MYKNIFILLVLVFFLIFFIIIGFNYNDNEYFYSSLTPEITGIIIELLIIILIFNRWQDKKKKEKLITLEKRLKEYLIFFLKHNFRTLPKNYRIGNFFGKDHEKNTTEINRIITYIQENGLKENEILSIQKHCARESQTLNSLLPVSAELTDKHFKAWCRIVYFINCIEKNDEPINKLTIDILQNIKSFDSASFKEKLYVGAI